MAGGLGGAEDLGRPSSASSGGSGASCDGRDQGFHSQMGENGIIGLDWVEEEAGLEAGGAEEGEGDPDSHQDPLEDQSFHLSELQDCQSSAGDGHARSLCECRETTPFILDLLWLAYWPSVRPQLPRSANHTHIW